MAFPSNPTNGQLATVNGVVYSYSTSKSAWTVTTSTQAALAGTSIAVTTTAAVGSTLTVTGTSTLASATFSGTASAAGNIIGGNILTSGVLTASTISSDDSIAAQGALSSVGYISQSRSDATMARITISNTNRNWTISNYGTSYSPNGAFAIADETGAVVRFRITPGANTDITGNVVASGNVTAPYFFGNGSLLTGLSTTSISSGTSSVAVIASGGNIQDNIAGVTIATTSSTGVAVTGNVTATSYLGSQFVQSTRNITANTTIGNINVMTSGPITINDNVVVTVSAGGEWTVV